MKNFKNRNNMTPSSESPGSAPLSADELANKFGTYNIQDTANTENSFPAIAQGLTDNRRLREETENTAQRTARNEIFPPERKKH